MKNSELQLADQVTREEPNTLGVCTVKQINGGKIHFFRPYTHTSDFSCTSGVICYVGVEEWAEEISDTRSDWALIARKPLK
jgi:hypothetical protein